VINKRSRSFWFGVLLAAAAGLEPCMAGERGRHDHDRARQAVEAGQALPLRTILERVEQDYPGQVMDVELEQRDARWIYELTILRAGGALLRLKVDARDGTVLHSKERPKPEHRHGGER
jgi:uncharacterized membrane protein YkoI